MAKDSYSLRPTTKEEFYGKGTFTNSDGLEEFIPKKSTAISIEGKTFQEFCDYIIEEFRLNLARVFYGEKNGIQYMGDEKSLFLFPQNGEASKLTTPEDIDAFLSSSPEVPKPVDSNNSSKENSEEVNEKLFAEFHNKACKHFNLDLLYVFDGEINGVRFFGDGKKVFFFEKGKVAMLDSKDFYENIFLNECNVNDFLLNKYRFPPIKYTDFSSVFEEKNK